MLKYLFYIQVSACTAQTTVSTWIFCQILLVIILRVIERRRRQNLGRDDSIAPRLQGLLKKLLRPLGLLLLDRAKGIDTGAVLGTPVIALAHSLCRIVAFPEGLWITLVKKLIICLSGFDHR